VVIELMFLWIVKVRIHSSASLLSLAIQLRQAIVVINASKDYVREYYVNCGEQCGAWECIAEALAWIGIDFVAAWDSAFSVSETLNEQHSIHNRCHATVYRSTLSMHSPSVGPCGGADGHKSCPGTSSNAGDNRHIG